MLKNLDPDLLNSIYTVYIVICDKRKLCTQVHVGGFKAMRMRDILVDGVQDLLLDLADGITVEHLYLDLWALLILRMDTVHHLQDNTRL